MAEEAKKTSKKVEELVEEVSKLSVMELSELVGALQDKLGVSAAVPVAAVQATPAGASAEASAPKADSIGCQ
jgi:large subunit ribosomal protein L7/L12